MKNSEQKDLKGPFAFFRQGSHSPMLIKMALGNLVIVGDVIDYLQRIQVQGGPPQPGSPSGTTVTISPANPKVAIGSMQPFTATVTGNTNTTVTWTVVCTAGGTACGSITSAGIYTAPLTVPSPPTVNVIATPAASGAQAALAVVTLH